jgi:hypothetical protein
VEDGEQRRARTVSLHLQCRFWSEGLDISVLTLRYMSTLYRRGKSTLKTRISSVLLSHRTYKSVQ